MMLTAFHGLCMALADSVPGVSGGRIAFILGFYDRFLDSLPAFLLGAAILLGLECSRSIMQRAPGAAPAAREETDLS